MTTPALDDSAARETARGDLGRNVLVEAGAGTGKTTLLIDRISALLLGPRPLDVSGLVALTFTEKAAAEIKFRLSERLHRAAAEGTEASRTLASAALRDLERARIETIHAFCAHLLRLYPIEAGADPEFRVDADGSAMDELFESEWALWLDVELGAEAPQAAAWREVLAGSELAGVAELAKALCRLPADPEAAPGAASPRLLELAAGVRALADGRAKPRGKILEFLPRLAGRLEESARAARGEAPGALEPLGAPPKWPANWDGEGEELYSRAAALAEKLDPGVEALCRKALELVAPFARKVRERYARLGWISFDGLLRGARDLVRQDLRVRAELKARFGAILVDEFQDTDPLQGELLMLLAEAGGSSGRHWREAVPEPGKLFVVGDPKQSIYRFRGADIAAVESFGAHLRRHGAAECALRSNFRSGPAIVGGVNEVFSRAMAAKPGLQPAYRAISAAAAAGGLPIERYEVQEGEEELSALEARRVEAAWLAAWISRERPGKGYKDVAVVLRSTGALGVYLDALKGAGIPYVVEGEKYFFGTQEVADFLNLLRAADDPEDRIAMAGLLRSPLALVEDAELVRLAEGGLLDYRKDPPAGLERLYAALRRANALAGREPLGEVVSRLFADTGLLEFACAAYSGQQTVSNLLKLRRMAAQAGLRGSTLKEFAAWVGSSVKRLREEGESPLADADYDAVRVLTIHKAKGLEYPIVILPDLSRASSLSGNSDAVRVSWEASRDGALLGLRLRGALSSNAAMAVLEQEEALRQREEEVRILYVAMTRAKERLILLGGPSRRKGSFAALLDETGALPALPLPAIDGAPKREARARAGAARLTLAQRRPLWEAREARRAQAQAKTLFVSPSAADAAASVGGSGLDRRSAACLGRLCHEALERWDYSAGRSMEGNDLGELLDARFLELTRREPQEPWDAALREAKELLERFTAGAAAKELAWAEILGREIPFAYEEAGQVVRGRIDLLYRLNGRTVVADYKTEAPPGPGEDPDARHQGQARSYLRAVERALGIPDVRWRVIYIKERTIT